MSKKTAPSIKLLRILCATLMLSLGFAHKPAVAIAATSVALDESYRLPDGSFAEICEGHTGVQTAHERGRANHSDMPSLFCEACLLASSILLPAPDANSWVRTQFAWLLNRPNLVVAAARHVDDQRPRARAPPSFA